MTNDAFILVLAFPETVVRVSSEWYSKFLPLVGIGSNGYVRAGHAAMVLIHKNTGILEYFDFGRYITPEPYGRVRSVKTDRELDFKLKAEIEEGAIANIKAIVQCFGSHPELTHGEGQLLASLCSEINYQATKKYIEELQNQGFVPYAAFKSNATNCVRFVTDALIKGCTNHKIRQNLKQTQRFTPSSISNVGLASSSGVIYDYSDGHIKELAKLNRLASNAHYFFDRLKRESITSVKTDSLSINEDMQWLDGIGSGAWFQLLDLHSDSLYGFKRYSYKGRLDFEGVFKLVGNNGFDMSQMYTFLHQSNCHTLFIKQNKQVYKFNEVEVASLQQRELLSQI